MIQKLGWKVIAGIVGVVLLIALVLFFTGTLSSLFTGRTQVRVSKGQAEAAIDSGAEASNTISNVAAADARTDQTVKGGIDDIRSQPAGNSNDAAVRAACRLRSHVNSERCAALRGVGASGPSGGR